MTPALAAAIARAEDASAVDLRRASEALGRILGDSGVLGHSTSRTGLVEPGDPRRNGRRR